MKAYMRRYNEVMQLHSLHTSTKANRRHTPQLKCSNLNARAYGRVCVSAVFHFHMRIIRQLLNVQSLSIYTV